MPRGGGGQPSPGIPAGTLGAEPSGAYLPAAFVLQQAVDRLRAGEGDPGRQGEAESGRDPQHISLAALLQELAQFGAGAIYLVPADESDGGAVCESRGEDADGQLPLSAEPQVIRQAHDQRGHQVADVFGRDLLPGADQRVPGALAHIRQMHRGDPVGYLAHAPQVVPLDAGRGTALLNLAGLIDRPAPQAPPPAAAAGGLLQPRHREQAHHPHRGEGVPDRAVQQPLGPLRSAIPCQLRDRPPIAPRQVTSQGSDVLASLKPRLASCKTRPQQRQQLSALPGRQGGPYPGSSSRLRFCCRHTHDRQAAAPCRTDSLTTLRRRSNTEWTLPY